MTKSLRIAFDFDGTIADTNAVKSAWIKEHLGLDVPEWKCERVNCVPIIGSQNYEKLAKFAYGEEGTRLAEPVFGAIDGIKTISTRAILFILTKRRVENKPFVKDWLARHGITHCFEDILLSTNRNKIQVCNDRGISLLLDNDPKNLEGIKKRKMSVLLFRPSTEDINISDHIIRVNNWQEVVAHAMRFDVRDKQSQESSTNLASN
jgi:uncharacterized HAD superfamily protein